MEKLSCEERNCLFNREKFCTKEEIAIDQQSVCVSYHKRSKDDLFKYEFANDEIVAGSSPRVCCHDCECVHNDEKTCCANHVVVQRQAFQNVRCVTFKPGR